MLVVMVVIVVVVVVKIKDMVQLRSKSVLDLSLTIHNGQMRD